MWNRLKQMLIKEFIQVFRDKRSRFVLFIPPLAQMLIFGYAATLDIRHVATAVLDYDNTLESRDLIFHFSGSPYFHVQQRVSDPGEIRDLIDRGQVILGLRIDRGFAQDLRKGQTASVQAIVDSSNSNTALVALSYVNQIAAKFAQDYQFDLMQRTSPMLAAATPNIVLQRQPWFNPDLRSQWFFVPGVIGNLIMVIVVILTAFAVVREREIGTLEQIMVTPIRRVEFILGKTIPFFLIGLLDATLISLVGTLWFRVPFRGSVWVLGLGVVLFLLCVLGVGLFISTVSATQQQAMVSSFFFIMPAVIFSGFGTPISSMPHWLQYLTYFDPLRYFLVVIRGVYLKGIGVDVLWPQMAAMLTIALSMLAISVLRFHKSIE